VIGNKTVCEPHHLNVAPGLTLEPAAPLNPIEIPVDVELQQDRRMIRRSAGGLGIDPPEPKSRQIAWESCPEHHFKLRVFTQPVP
jgi:hypothetical protein